MDNSGANQKWAVVGGGMLGLTLAYRLRQLGHEVVLIEAAPEIGGMAGAWSIGDIVWDRHYHVTLMSDLSLRGLIKELGLEQEMEWTETRTGVYADSKLHSVSNPVEFLRFPPLGLIDKIRLGATLMIGSKIRNWKKLEQMTVSDWLQRWSGRNAFERFWLPLLRSKLGDNYKISNAAFIWATIQRLNAARSAGLRKEMFGYVRGGYARLLARFAEVLERDGVTIQLDTRVDNIASQNESLAITFGNGETHGFDNVVVTAQAPQAARMSLSLNGRERELLEGIAYQGIVCASLLLKQPLSEFYVTNLLDRELPFTGVIEMSALVNPDQIKGHGLIYLPRYLASDDPFFELPDSEIEERFVCALERMYPDFSRSDVLTFQLSRVKHVYPVPTIGYSTKLPPISTSVPGLYLLNSSHIVNGTMNVNETVRLAENSLAKISRRSQSDHYP